MRSFSSNHRREPFLLLPAIISLLLKILLHQRFFLLDLLKFVLCVIRKLSKCSFGNPFETLWAISFIISLINDSIQCILGTSVCFFQYVFVEGFLLRTSQASLSVLSQSALLPSLRLPSHASRPIPRS